MKYLVSAMIFLFVIGTSIAEDISIVKNVQGRVCFVGTFIKFEDDKSIYKEIYREISEENGDIIETIYYDKFVSGIAITK